MNTRRLATAVERERVSSRMAQAWGLVSRTMVRREAAVSDAKLGLLASLVFSLLMLLLQ